VQESGLATPESVLTRAAEMAICELVAEPQVRKAVREPFLRKALVSTGAASHPLLSLFAVSPILVRRLSSNRLLHFFHMGAHGRQSSQARTGLSCGKVLNLLVITRCHALRILLRTGKQSLSQLCFTGWWPPLRGSSYWQYA